MIILFLRKDLNPGTQSLHVELEQDEARMLEKSRLVILFQGSCHSSDAIQMLW